MRCTIAAVPEADAVAGLACARGHGALVHEDMMETCNECRGSFLTRDRWDELLLAIHRGESVDLSRVVPPLPGHAPSTFPTIQCPVCGTTMERATFAATSKIVIDVCSAHGVWLDATELVGVVHVLQRRIEGVELPVDSTMTDIDKELERMRAITHAALSLAERHLREQLIKRKTSWDD